MRGGAAAVFPALPSTMKYDRKWDELLDPGTGALKDHLGDAWDRANQRQGVSLIAPERRPAVVRACDRWASRPNVSQGLPV